jgi:hypothetical protein
MGVPVLLSKRPAYVAEAVRVAPGVEVKLDWEDAAELGAGNTLTDACVEQGVDPAAVVSVHLPPGTTDRNGMSVAAENVGVITDFTHTAFGNGLDPEWLTLHSDRWFDYREHVDALGTITDLTGYPVALESGTDRGQFLHPEHLAVFAFLAEHVDQLADTYVLVDTAHIPDDRMELAVFEDVVGDILEEMDAELRSRVEEPFRRFLQDRVAQATIDLDAGDPWRPALTALHMVGGDRVRAVHLNDPENDGAPDVSHGASDGMRAVVEFCRRHDVAIVIEPGTAGGQQVEAVLQWLGSYCSSSSRSWNSA